MAEKSAIARRIAKAVPMPKVAKQATVKFKKPTDLVRSGPQKSNYYAWQTANGKAPDLGKGQAGPGTPYQEVLKRRQVDNSKPTPVPPNRGPLVKPKPPTRNPGVLPRRGRFANNAGPGAKPNPDKPMDAKAEAIRRRLSNGY